MRNKETWQPSKFEFVNGKWIASRDRRQVGLGSRLAAELIASRYDRYIKDHVRGRLIDLGCGRVPLYGAYKPYVGDNVCVDWENTLHKNEHLDLECDLNTELPFADGEFDTVIFSDVLEHVPKPEQVLKEVSRILAAGGKLLLNVPFYYCIHEEPHDYYRYTHFALRRFMANAGLKLVLLEPTGGAPEVLADTLAKNLLQVPRIGELFAVLIQRATLAFIATNFGKAVSKSTSEKFPFGYFLIAEKPLQLQ